MARLREGLRIGSLVGDDHAAKAPLAAHHVGDKAPVVAGPDQAHAIHAEHDAQGALVAARDAGLEGGQVTSRIVCSLESVATVVRMVS